MASLASIAGRRKEALERLTDAMHVIAEKFGVEPIELPRKARQRELLYAQHLEALADWAEGIALAALPVSDSDETSLEFSDEQLRAIAAGLGWSLASEGISREKFVEMIRETPIDGLGGEATRLSGVDDAGNVHPDEAATETTEAEAVTVEHTVTDDDGNSVTSEIDVTMLPDPPFADQLEAMSRDDVVRLANDRGMPTNSRTTKTEAADWLLAAKGVSEDEQAESSKLESE